MTADAKPAAKRPRGRPKTSPLSRVEQLRRAKRAQRHRARELGFVDCPISIVQTDAEKLKFCARQPGFEHRLRAFLAENAIEVNQYENLNALCWNRTTRFIGAEEAFRLYERNWRHVDRKNMKNTERALIDRLTDQYGNGVLNV